MEPSAAAWRWNRPARFGLSCLALFALFAALPASAFGPLNRHTAAMAARLLAHSRFEPVLSGTILSRGGFAVEVIHECTVVPMAILFLSFVVAAPGTARRKAVGLLAGVAALHAANVARIALVFVLGGISRPLFESAHVYLGQTVMVLAVVTACAAWLQLTSPDASSGGAAVFAARFTAGSAVPFLLLMAFDREYVRLTDTVVRGLFALWDVHLRIPYQHAIYYQTFNLVTLIGLFVADRKRWDARKARLFAAGLAAMGGLHLAFRVCDVLIGNVLIASFHGETAFRVSTGISLIGQYLVPVIFWMSLDVAWQRRRTRYHKESAPRKEGRRCERSP
ncbi:MAG: exosortase H [Candidatus Deferrimicrobium sp.]